MPDLAHETLRAAFAAQSLFEDKTWQLSPAAWPLTPAQVTELEAIGTACLEFHTALETLYLRSAAGKNLLRNKPLVAPWVAEYLDRGKPPALIDHARYSCSMMLPRVTPCPPSSCTARSTMRPAASLPASLAMQAS